MSFKDHKHYLSRFFCTFCLTLSRAATQLRIFGKLKVRVGRWETHLLLFKQGLVYLGVGTYSPNIPIKKLGLCFLGIKAWVEGYFKTHYEHCEITRDWQWNSTVSKVIFWWTLLFSLFLTLPQLDLIRSFVPLQKGMTNVPNYKKKISAGPAYLLLFSWWFLWLGFSRPAIRENNKANLHNILKETWPCCNIILSYFFK